jgi:hypothetical protein
MHNKPSHGPTAVPNTTRLPTVLQLQQAFPRSYSRVPSRKEAFEAPYRHCINPPIDLGIDPGIDCNTSVPPSLVIMMSEDTDCDDPEAVLSSGSDDDDEEEADGEKDADDVSNEEVSAAAAVPAAVPAAATEWSVHPARKILKEALLNGDIPTDYNRQGGPNYALKPRMIYDEYKTHQAFAGMSGKEFTDKLNRLRKIVEKRNKRVVDDMHAFEVFRNNFPVQPINHRGEPRWEGSQAQALLKQDIEMGRDLEFHRMRLLWLSRPEYQQFTRKVFLGHIDQEKRLCKLKTLLEEKLSREFRERFRELLRLARSGISEFLAGAPEFRRGTPLCGIGRAGARNPEFLGIPAGIPC